MKMLIAYDGSQFADAAVRDLAHAALGDEGVEAVVLSVADVWPPTVSTAAAEAEALGAPSVMSLIGRRARELAETAVDDARQTATRGAQLLATLFPRWRITPEWCGDSPAGALVARAQAIGADLLVTSSHGATGRGRAGWGSVAQKVVTHAPCSVRVGRRRPGTAPADDARDRPVRLLVGIDGSDAAALAVQAVAGRHWPAGSEARVVTVLDVRVLTALAFAPISTASRRSRHSANDEPHEWARQATESCATELRDAGLAVTTAVAEGDPRAVLLAEAEQWSADCVFVGAKGMSRVERFLLGSVSGSLAARAPCSVEVVRISLSVEGTER